MILMVFLITGTEMLLILVVGQWSLVLQKTLSLACKFHIYMLYWWAKCKFNVKMKMFWFRCRGTPSQNLSGTLSPSITNLTNLRIVWVLTVYYSFKLWLYLCVCSWWFLTCRLLQNNNITGKLPSEIGRLKRLETLDLSDNFFRGEIPFSIGYLRSLQYL